MARKRVNKTKKLQKAISAILVIIILLVALVCYFYPPFYNFILSFFKDDEPEFRVEGDTTIVTELRDLKVHFVDVGQGDCIIIELPDGKNVLIDSGEKNYKQLDYYIKNKTSVKVFDYVIATHADADHIGNFDDIFKNYEVKYVYRPYVKYSGTNFTFDDEFNQGSSKYKQKSNAYGTFLNYLKNETYTENDETKPCGYEFFTHESDFAGKIQYNDEVYEYYFDFLTPTIELSSLVYTIANDYSPIIKFTYQGVDILFTGDSEGGDEGDGEDDFVAYYKNLNPADLDVEILKVGHHGSRSSTTQELLDLVKPEYSVIQCGIDNSYKHPHQVTLDRLLAAGSAVYRTDIQGNILLTITNSGTFNFATQNQTNIGLFIGGDA